MEFTWNEEKNEENMQKHGVDFQEVQEIFDDPFHFSMMDTRFNYFEERWITIGRAKNGLTIVAGHLYLFDEKGTETVRLIIARKATRKEREDYEHIGR
jgi:uncharacterized DUF497 family protein